MVTCELNRHLELPKVAPRFGVGVHLGVQFGQSDIAPNRRRGRAQIECVVFICPLILAFIGLELACWRYKSAL